MAMFFNGERGKIVVIRHCIGEGRMASADVKRIAQEIKSLNPTEREQLLALVQSDDAKRPMTEEEFEIMLFEQGKLVARPTGLPTDPWTPIDIPGPPMSQTIIEDRR
jgi:hypothetical protein